MPRLPDHVSFTMIPNFILDENLESLSEGELKILLTIYRKTVGFDKRSDKIPYSQFVEHTSLSKSTISKGIKALVNKKLVKVDRSENINRYMYCLPIINNSGSSKSEPQLVQNSNRQPVRNSNTQKKTLKESKRNTTSSDLSDDLVEVIKYWNKTFSNTLDPSDISLLKCIEKALTYFTVKKFKKAIFNRNYCSYYRDKKPQLLNKPSAFFPYPETIANDLFRNPECIFNYDEKNQRIWDKKNVDEDFEILRDRKDEENRPMWKLLTSNY